MRQGAGITSWLMLTLTFPDDETLSHIYKKALLYLARQSLTIITILDHVGGILLVCKCYFVFGVAAMAARSIGPIVLHIKY